MASWLPDAEPHPDPAPAGPSPLEVEPLRVEPEVRLVGDHVHVTLAHPEVSPEDLAHFVGSNIVLVWSRTDPHAERLLVHLPCDVQADTAVVRLTNGVFDLTVLTARAAPGATPSASRSLSPTSPRTDGSQ